MDLKLHEEFSTEPFPGIVTSVGTVPSISKDVMSIIHFAPSNRDASARDEILDTLNPQKACEIKILEFGFALAGGREMMMMMIEVLV